ncbi:MAG: penicillin-binding protein 2 [Candidatus Atribacteria bacterium]|nr:penicillin-binding protein 2 [Candidatus Atribacteria bacterium]
MSSRRFVQRANFLVILFFLVFGYVVLRLFTLQVVQGHEYQEKASLVRFRMEDLIPPRGSILDRNGEILARDTEAISICCIPKMVEDPRQTALTLSSILLIDKSEIQTKISGNRSFTWIRRQVPLYLKEPLEKARLKGIEWRKENRRFYPQAPLLSNLLGFVGIDHRGLEGLEYAFDQDLTGQTGYMTFEQGGTGREIPGSLTYLDSQPGHDLILTIDSSIQFFVEKALDAAVERTRARAGLIVVNDPRTGDILAMASRPRYDNSRFNQYPSESWKNLPISMLIEPGSTVKPLVMAAALQENLVSMGDNFFCGGSIMVYNHRVRDIKSHGQETLSQVLINSCNVGIIQIAQRLGEDRLYRYFKGFGIGEGCDTGLSSEELGLLRRPRDWSALSIGAVPIGQEILVTPIQLLRAMSAIANKGTAMKVRLLKKIVDLDGKVVREVLPAPVQKVVSPETADIVLNMMEQVVAIGTGKKAAITGYHIAGKTGTGQKIGSDGRYAPNRFYSSFIGFLPIPDPQFGILVVLDEAQGEYYGGDIAAPVFQEVAQNIINLTGMMPDNAEVKHY